MGLPVFAPRTAGARRLLRLGFVILAALSVVTCAEDPIGPAISEGRLRVVPVFEASARLAPLAIDRVRVVVTRIIDVEQLGDVVVDDTFAFDVDDNQLTIRDIRVPMEEQTESFLIRLEMLANTVLLFQGTESVTLTRGRTSTSSSIPMAYQGPGANVASLSITPRDTTIAPRATFTFSLDAQDNQGAPVPDFYASWSLTGGPATGARINSAGQLTAPSVPDTFYVKAVSLPNGVADSTLVIIGTITPPPPTQVIPTPLTAGDGHTCEIRSTGTYCWGRNSNSQLGDGTTTDRLIPTPVLGGQVFVAVSAGYSHTCGLTAQGTAFCWGDNTTGALGDGTTTDHATPVAVSGGLTFAQISAGLQFTCAVTLTGEGRCWGANFIGQLGDGTFTERHAPTLVSGNHNFTRISGNGLFDGSEEHACAIDNNGAAWCWGGNNNGQLGNGSQTDSNIPVAVSGGRAYSEISVGEESSCAITTAGVGFCWGNNFGVQLTTPTPVAGGLTYSTIDMGGNHVCGKTATGWVCGGDGSSGQLGDGSGADQQTPVAPAGGRTYSVVAAGGRHTCGITATGTFCWGLNQDGQLGIGDTEGTGTSVPAAVMGAPASITILAGNNQTTLVNVEVTTPPQVRVLDAAGQPVGGAEVIWTVTAGGGSINQSGATFPVSTGTDGIAAVTWALGPNPGANSLSARVSAGGVTGNPASFTATATNTAAAFIWTGASNTDWAVPGNWNPAQVPGIADSVVIGAATNQPLLSVNQVVGAVSIVAGGRLGINGQGLVVARGLSTGGTGVLVMQSDQDVVTIGGNAVFDGGNELNLLSAGGLSIGGNLTQRATNSGDSFHPSGTHITLLTGTAPTLSFATPGVVPGTSHFQELAWSGGGTMTLLTQAMAHGNMTIISQAAGTIASANGSRLTVGNLITAAGLTLNNVPLTISQAVSGPLSLSNISFTAMPTTVAQLVINHPGEASAFTFTNLQFNTVPVAPNGFYLDVTDNNGATDGVLTINMSGAAPATGAPFVQTAGGAVVNWPFNATSNWTGAISTDWSNAGNWSTGAVPGAASDVAIGPATLQPILSANSTARNITVSGAGARLTIGSHQLDVTGNLTVHTDGLLVMANTNDLVIVTGDAFFQGGNETGFLTAGELRLFGNFNQQQQTTPLSFVASGSHRTVMRGTATLQTVTFCCTANTSGFQNLDLSQSMGINIQFSGNGVRVFDTLTSRPGAGPTPWLYMLGSPLTARRFNIDRLTVDRGTLSLNEQGVAGTQLFDNVTFQNYLPTQTQLAITAAGGTPNRTLAFNNLAFQALTTGDAGKYLTATSSGQTLVVNLPGATPANGPSFTTIAGATTVNWPGSPITWTGATNTSWTAAGNWSTGAVPNSTDTVFIGAAANQPTLNALATVGALVIGNGGNLNLGGNTLTVQRGFVTTGTGVLTSTVGGSGLTVLGNILFSGGNETSLLTSGTITARGNFAVGATGTSFVASNIHATIFNGTTAQTLTIPAGGPAGSRFQNVQITNTAGPVTLGTAGQVMQVSGNLTLIAGTTLTGAGNLAAGGVSVPIGGTLSVAQLTVPTGTFSIAGIYTVPQTILTGGGNVPNAPYLNLTLPGPGGYSPLGNISTAGNLEIQSGFNTGNATVSVARTLRITGAGVLSMTDAGSQVNADSAVFAGSDETGQLSAGNLTVRVALVQFSTVSPSSFVGTLGHTVTLTGPNVSVDFQTPVQSPLMHLVSNAGNTVIGFLRVNGNLNASGNNFNASTLNVRGTMTTAIATGCGIDSLILGSNLPAGNGYIAANHYVFDQTTGTQTIPAQNANLPYNDNNADITVLSNAILGGNVITNGLSIRGTGQLAFGGNRATVNGGFSTAGSGLLSMTNPLDSLIVSGNVAFNGGNEFGSLTDGNLILAGNFSHAADQFRATGNHRTVFTGAAASITSTGTEPRFNDLTITGITTLATPTIAIRDLVLQASARLNSQTTQDLRGVRNVTAATGSQVIPFLLEMTGTITSSGLVSPDNLLFSGTGTIPASSANIVYKRIQVTNASTGYTLGGTVTAPNGMALSGSLSIGANTLTINDLLVSTPTGRLIMTNPAGVMNIATIASFDGGDETGQLTAGTILISGSMTQSATNSVNSFRASGTHSVFFNGSGASQIGFATAGSQFQNLVIDMPSGTTTITDGTVVAAGNLTISRGRLVLNGRRVDVGQNLALNGTTSTIAMQNPADSLIVGNAATFAGASTNGLLTAGVLRVSGDFTQSAVVSQLSFAPSGSHKTVLGSAAGSDISIGSPGLGAAGSHFQVLDVTPATGGLTLDVNMQADSLISTSNLARLVSSGQTLTVRRAQVSGLASNGVPLILDEQGVASTENLSGINFTGFPTTGTTMLTVIGPGNSFAPRPTVTANNVIFQTLPIGAGNFYVDLTTTNDQAFTLNMVSSNQRIAAGGNGPSLTRTTGIGAVINWP